MRYASADKVVYDAIPGFWGWIALACSVVILCSCAAPVERPSAMLGQSPHPGDRPYQQVSYPAQGVPPGAPVPIAHTWNGAGSCGGAGCGGAGCGSACGGAGCGNGGLWDDGTDQGPQWRPQNLLGVWPPDEYICDGGDRGLRVDVGPDWRVFGLETEDTVAQYDTLDGETLIEPSNRVCIYAPRFAAVRVVTGAYLDEQVRNPVVSEQPIPVIGIAESVPPIARVQNLQPGREVGLIRIENYQGTQWDGIVGQVLAAWDASVAWKAHENFSVMKYGVLLNEEKPQLAQMVDAALEWAHDQAIQVVLDEQRADVVTYDARVQEVFRVYEFGPSKLRIIKTASTNSALPGEIVDFTLRFDNVGPRVIGNVVIMDNLTPRLEYVEGSAGASVKTGEYQRDEAGEIVRDENGHAMLRQNPVRFMTQVNEGQSLVLRWELDEPLEPGQGGVLRFKARVREPWRVILADLPAQLLASPR